MRLFLNPHARSYLRELAREFSVSTNAVREELNQLSRTDLLKVEKEGRNVFYSANTDHALFPELRSMVQKVMGIDQVVDGIVRRLGKLESCVPYRRLRRGKGRRNIDLILIGEVDQYHLNDLCRKTEKYVHRKIRTMVMCQNEYHALIPNLTERPHLLVWEAGK